MKTPGQDDRKDKLQSWLDFVSAGAGAVVPWAPLVAAGMRVIIEHTAGQSDWKRNLPAPPDAQTLRMPALAERHLETLLDAIEKSPPSDMDRELLSEITGYRALVRTYPNLLHKWLVKSDNGQPLVPFVELWHADFRPDAPPRPLRFAPDFDSYAPPAITQGLGLRIDAITAPKLKKNEAKLRVRRIHTAADSVTIDFSVCRYRDYLRSNWAIANLEAPYAMELRKSLCGVGELLPLEKSGCANALGVSAIVAFDDELILPVSSSNVISSPNMIVPSASGGADFMPSYWFDGIPSPAQDILREAQEELHIDIRDFRKSSVRLLALARNVLRGGNPEAFFYVHMPMRYRGTASDEHLVDSAIRLPALLTAAETPVDDFDQNLRDVQAFIKRPSEPGDVVSPFTRVALHYYAMFAQGCRQTYLERMRRARP